MSDLSITVAIITRQRRGDVIKAVASALADLGSGDEIVVLENGCPESSTAGLEEEFPTVRWERTSENLGVTGGRNRLVELSSTPLILFLDDDSEIHPGSIGVARTHFRDHPRTGVVAMRMDDPATGIPRRHEFPARDKSRYQQSFECTYFIGGAFVVRRDTLRDVGPFDGWLFYGLEELEISYRIVEAEWRIWYLPEARTSHHAADAGRPSGQYFYYHTRNRYRVAVTRLPWRFAGTQIAIWTAYFGLKALRARQLRHFGRGLAAGLRAVPEAIRRRQPISRATVDYLKAHDGRLLY